MIAVVYNDTGAQCARTVRPIRSFPIGGYMAESTPVVSTPVMVTTVEVDATVGTVKPYVTPDSTFAEVPITLHDMLTDLARNKFSDEIAAGHVTDKHMRGFRTAYVRDVISGLHKQLVKRVSEKTEKTGRDFYRSLRARGVSVCESITLSGYMPDDAVCTCTKCKPVPPVKK